MSALDEFNNGQLATAIELAAATLRTDPADRAARFLFAQLQCFNGELEKADRHFELFQKQSEVPVPGVALCRQLVRAAMARSECFTAGRLPEFFSEPSASVQFSLKALAAFRDGHLNDAADFLGQATEHASAVTGTINDAPFTSLSDLDDLTSNVLEVFTPTGKYFWIPFNSIRSLELHPPKRPLDLLWRPAKLDVVDGPDGEVFLPLIYPTLATDTLPESARLGRSTDWVSIAADKYRGMGLRIWLANDTEHSLLEVSSVRLPSADDSSAVQEGITNGQN